MRLLQVRVNDYDAMYPCPKCNALLFNSTCFGPDGNWQERPAEVEFNPNCDPIYFVDIQTNKLVREHTPTACAEGEKC